MDSLTAGQEVRRLGTTALRVFPLAYGCWRFAGTDVATARAKVETAREVGITLFDHADIYGGEGAAEALFGQVLAEAPRLREGMLIATKCGIIPGVPYDSSPAHVERSVEGSLRRLGVDVIDLFQIHRPDLLTHPGHVAATLSRLREVGKIREVGVSNFTPDQFVALQRYLDFPLATHQPEFSAWWLAPLRDGVVDQCLERRVTPLAWSPLAGGKLGLTIEAAASETGGERLQALLACLDAIAAAQGVSRTAVALAFLLVHPAGVIPILGTQNPARLREGLEALRVKLSRQEWYAILQASQGKKLP